MRKQVIALFAAVVALPTQAASIPFSAEIATLEGLVGSPFALGQTVTGVITISEPLGTDLAGSNTLTVYSGVSSMTVSIAGAGFTASGGPSGGTVVSPTNANWQVDTQLDTFNGSSDRLTLNIGVRDAPPNDFGGSVTGNPAPVGGGSNAVTLQGLSIDLIDSNDDAFASLGANPDPIAALNIALNNLGLFNNAGPDRAQVRLHFAPPLGEFSPSKITANIVPIPAAVWMFGSALGLLGALRRRFT